MLYNLKFINEIGQSITFETEKKGGVFVQPDSPASIKFQGYKLIAFEDGIKADIHTQKSYNQDGSTHIMTTLEERYPYLEFIIVADDYDELSRLRRNAAMAFNPKFKVDVLLSQGGNSYKLTVIPESAVNFISEDAVGRTQIGTVSMVSPNSYWESSEIYSQEIVSWIGGLTFPLKLPTAFSLKGEEVINVINRGDAPAPVEILIRGKATNPKIINKSTGEFIKVNRELQEDDMLKITTGFGDKRVEQNGVSVFNYIDLESTFFNLRMGDNLIEMLTEDINDLASIKISYQHKYIGV